MPGEDRQVETVTGGSAWRRRGGGHVELVTAEWRELEAAGWEPEEYEGGTIWCNPSDGYWYDQLRAVAFLGEGLDPGGGC